MSSIGSREIWAALGSVALLAGCGGEANGSGKSTAPDLFGETPPSAGGYVTGTGGGTPSAGGSPVGTTGGMGGGPDAPGGSASGTGGASGETGGAPAASGGAGEGDSRTGEPPPCVSSPTEVVILGDSYVTGAASPALQPALATLDATAAQFRNYAVAGTSLAGGGVGQIPPQLDLAISLDPKIQLIIMDGGGNDILLCDGVKFPGCGGVCNRAGSASQTVCTDIVHSALDVAGQLFDKAAQAGVKDLIYFFYPHITSNMGGFKDIIDYAEPLFLELCGGAETATGGKLRCHFVDLVQPFTAAGGDLNPANFSVFDGIHPSQAGQNIIAKEIAGVMKAKCLGEAASGGCCAP